MIFIGYLTLMINYIRSYLFNGFFSVKLLAN